MTSRRYFSTMAYTSDRRKQRLESHFQIRCDSHVLCGSEPLVAAPYAYKPQIRQVLWNLRAPADAIALLVIRLTSQEYTA